MGTSVTDTLKACPWSFYISGEIWAGLERLNQWDKL